MIPGTRLPFKKKVHSLRSRPKGYQASGSYKGNPRIAAAEMAARRRLKELRKSKRAADEGWGPLITPAQQAAFRLLTLLYPLPPNPKPDESTLADHPFRDLRVADDDTVSSPKAPQRPASTLPQPDPDDDFVEFDDTPPPFCTIDRELSAKKGRTILKWTYEV
jgi:hypothetical protein